MKFVFDPNSHRYPSKRNLVYGRKGMVATGNPLAAQAGLDMLKKGGNAVDAAIAAATALTVVEPVSNGIGGDAFAIVWMDGKLYGLNASGPAPELMSAGALRERGFSAVPVGGVMPVTVPGAPSAWAVLCERFGRLPLTEIVGPAVSYAEEGFVIQPNVGVSWEAAYRRYVEAAKTDSAVRSWAECFAPDGRCLGAGDVLVLKDHATTLTEIAETRGESFYRGRLARATDEYFRSFDSFLRAEDLAAYRPQWVRPIYTSFGGYEVHEIPPNGQGITVLMALNILKNFDFSDPQDARETHRQIEALKLALTDAMKYVGEPGGMRTEIASLLDQDYADRRAALITAEALEPSAGMPDCGGTVYLCTADAEGNMVSYIQSNYMGFGSGVVVPGTGIAMHNRGCNFNLDESSDNCVGPGKRPYHTIIPGFLTRGGKAVGPFGIMGAFMQSQAHLQVLIDLIKYGMNPQEALDRPRWQWISGRRVEIEQGFDHLAAERLAAMGHEIEYGYDTAAFGRGEMILTDDEGVLVGATESRTDGCVAVW